MWGLLTSPVPSLPEPGRPCLTLLYRKKKTSGLPHSIPFLKHPSWPAPRTATILITVHSLPHLTLLIPVRIR